MFLSILDRSRIKRNKNYQPGHFFLQHFFLPPLFLFSTFPWSRRKRIGSLWASELRSRAGTWSCCRTAGRGRRTWRRPLWPSASRMKHWQQTVNYDCPCKRWFICPFMVVSRVPNINRPRRAVLFSKNSHRRLSKNGHYNFCFVDNCE